MENQEQRRANFLFLHVILWMAAFATWAIVTIKTTDLKDQYAVNIKARDQIILSYRSILSEGWSSCKEVWDEEPAKVRCTQKSNSKITAIPNAKGNGEFGRSEANE